MDVDAEDSNYIVCIRIASERSSLIVTSTLRRFVRRTFALLCFLLTVLLLLMDLILHYLSQTLLLCLAFLFLILFLFLNAHSEPLVFDLLYFLTFFQLNLLSLTIPLFDLLQNWTQIAIECLQLLLQVRDIASEFLLFLVGRNCTRIELVERQPYDNGVEKQFVDRLYPLLEKNLLLKFSKLRFMSRFEHLVIEPVLKSMITPPERNEDPSERHHLVLLLPLFEIAQHRLGEGSDQKREYLLKGNHSSQI